MAELQAPLAADNVAPTVVQENEAPPVRKFRARRIPPWVYVLLVVLALTSPVLVVLLLLWGFIGYLCRQTPLVLAAFGVIVNAAALGAISPGTAIGWGLSEQVFDAAILAVLVLGVNCGSRILWRGRTLGGRMSLLLAVGNLIFDAFKFSAGAPQHYELSGIATAMLIIDMIVPFVSAAAVGRYWIPATRRKLDAAERKVLEASVKTPFTQRHLKGVASIELGPVTPSAEPTIPIVLVHGYAAGNAFWTLNLDALAQRNRVYALDWIGAGRSERKKFTTWDAEAAENWFIDHIEAWRDAHPDNIQKMVLVGHSLGGIICTGYAMRYPERVQHLVLASPAGVPDPPKASNLPSIFRLVRWLWSKNLTPNAIVRFFGPIGPRLVRTVLRARFSVEKSSPILEGTLPLDDVAWYTYQNWAGPASAEYAMNTVLSPGAFARRPLTHRITPYTIPMPLTFIYGGDEDWMDAHHADRLQAKLEAAGKRDIRVLKLDFGGHQLFINNPEQFNSAVLTAVYPPSAAAAVLSATAAGH